MLFCGNEDRPKEAIAFTFAHSVCRDWEMVHDASPTTQDGLRIRFKKGDFR